MAGHDLIKMYDRWKWCMGRGRRRILKASKDGVARQKLLAGILPPVLAKFRLTDADVQTALGSLPAYLSSPAARDQTQLAVGASHGFLTRFPPEVRNKIYDYAVDYPACQALFDSYYHSMKKSQGGIRYGRPAREHRVGFYTPTILLLCKQITREALTVLRLRPFVIDRMPPWIMGNDAPFPIANFVGRQTLQNLRFVEIKLALGESSNLPSGKVWLHLLKAVLEIWSERNSLVRLKVMFKIGQLADRTVWYRDELDNYTKIVDMINYFEFRHGAKPGMVDYEHWILDLDCAYKVGPRNPPIRMHPDPNIWQGSIVEWV